MSVFSNRTIYYPVCTKELNWYLVHADVDYLLCVSCNKFFKKANLSETDLPLRIIDHLKSINYTDDYKGIPTSYFYSPKWLIKLKGIFHKLN